VTSPAELARDAPDPADALRRAERLAHAGVPLAGMSADELRIARVACQRAPYLATLLARDPTRLARVAADPYLDREKPAAVVAAELTRALAAAPLTTALRQVRADELVRLGVRELEHGGDAAVGRQLATLADACFDAAIAACGRELSARHGPPRYVDDDGTERDAVLCVIGMGKLGAQELNFASDVDVIYVYSSDHGTAGALSLHEYFAKLCTAVSAALSNVTDEDIVFRVDLRLRPEGGRGPIANSLAQLERYYETFGRPWERQAWIKARACAGDAALGAEVVRTLEPFVFPRVTSPRVIEDVRELNRRIKRELVRGKAGFDVKNGEGGIREIEFFVQALQLVHAGKRPALRPRATLAALDALLFAGLVSDDEHRALWRAYRWLRHAEHVLQLEVGLQTQTIPDDPEHRALFARRLGLADRDALAAVLGEHTSAVARLFATLGGDGDDDGARAEIAAVLGGELADDAEAAALARLGFADVTTAQHELARARRQTDSPLATSASRGVTLFAECAASADPDQALRVLGDLVARRHQASSIWRLLDEQPAIARLVGSLLGASAYLGRILVDTPEVIDLLIELGQTAPTRDVTHVRGELDAKLAQVDASDPEAAWSAIAEVKAAHVLRVGLADFAGALHPLAVCVELTAIAEACLGAALGVVTAQLPRHSSSLCVCALGKLGGRELGYAADLDVIFIYDGGDDDEIVHVSRVAQRLLGALRQRTPRGRLYELDTRLRPSGSQGLLVSSLDSWRRYHSEAARLWERQALVKLRPVAGDPALGAEVARIADATVWGTPPGDARAIAHAIAAMRERIELELGAPTDLKTGAGGIIDVEFAAQYLQLVHGHAHRELRTPSTEPALAAADDLGLAPHGALGLLIDGYHFLRGIEHRLRVVHDQPIRRLPETRAELDKLARRCGLHDGAVLLAHVERVQRDVRAAYMQLVSA
jgi:glutamate-ammonia-ligase adenylyltransferase